jgi:hypothetical protein
MPYRHAACRGSQVSYVGPGPLRLFAQALADDLQGTGTGSSHDHISASDLWSPLDLTLRQGGIS